MKKTLKFLSWMFVAVLSVLSFSSCSDDDEGHPYAGTVWEYEDIYESGTITHPPDQKIGGEPYLYR